MSRNGSGDYKIMCEAVSNFDAVDEKVAETEFFLQKMSSANTDFYEFKWYFSAFLSASRTVTLTLQQFKHFKGFNEWYLPHQKKLSTDLLARFFLKQRNLHVHGHPNPVSGGAFFKGNAKYQFSPENLPLGKKISNNDVLSVSREYFIKLLEVIYDCYFAMGTQIDPQQYYTKEHFQSLEKDINQAEGEVFGWICKSLIEEGYTDDDRWYELRAKVDQCKINHLFYSYLGKPTPQPILPEHYQDFADTPEDKGWEYAPAGFKSLDEYRKMAKDL
jgi:hypothetical protein